MRDPKCNGEESPRTTFRAVLTAPEQVLEVRPNRLVLQSRVQFGSAARLIRVFVDVDRVPAEVVTVYRTSWVAKYWEE